MYTGPSLKHVLISGKFWYNVTTGLLNLLMHCVIFGRNTNLAHLSLLGWSLYWFFAYLITGFLSLGWMPLEEVLYKHKTNRMIAWDCCGSKWCRIIIIKNYNLDQWFYSTRHRSMIASHEITGKRIIIHWS